MSTIVQRLTNFIRTKPRGEDVRTSIADGLDAMDERLDTAIDNQILTPESEIFKSIPYYKGWITGTEEEPISLADFAKNGVYYIPASATSVYITDLPEGLTLSRDGAFLVIYSSPNEEAMYAQQVIYGESGFIAERRISSQGVSRDWHVYTTSDQLNSAVNTIINRLETDIYQGRSTDGLTPTPMARFTPNRLTFESLLDMPYNTYTTMTGRYTTAQESNPDGIAAGLVSLYDVLPDTFEWKSDLRRGITYFVYRIGGTYLSPAVTQWYIMSSDGTQKYIGRNSFVSLDTISFSNNSNLYLRDEFYRDSDDFIYVGDFSDAEQYWWNPNGTYDTSVATGTHSDLIPIVPGRKYYLSGNVITTCIGAFFRADKSFLEPLYGTTASAVPEGGTQVHLITPSYDTPTEETYPPDQAALDSPDMDYYPASSYMQFATFTAPPNAAFFSLNVSNSTTGGYRVGFCSKRIFMLRGTGNLMLKKGDLALQKYGKKKLCIIGPSTVMIDLLRRRGANVDISSTDYAYTSGWQEYLKPFFKEITGLGYSGAGYSTVSGTLGSAHRCPIYYRICGGTVTVPGQDAGDPDVTYTCEEKNLSGYDVFILYSNTNGLTMDTMGTYDSTDPATFCGALRKIINKIYTDNPLAEIWIANWPHYYDEDDPNPVKAASAALKNAGNEQLKLMADMLSLGYIDMYHTSGNTPQNWAHGMSIDDHPGNEGNRKNGLCIRKAMIGF